MSHRDLIDALVHEPAKREIYLTALNFVKDSEGRTGRFDLERVIDQCPERTSFFQPAGSLIDALVGFGALDEELPAPEYDEDIEEEFIDRALATYGLTDEGREAVVTLSPASRLQALLEREGQRRDGLVRLMTFCAEQKRSRHDIDELLKDACAAEKSTRHVAASAIYPSYYVDCLERAGALKWSDGWTTTEEALAYLAVFQ